MMLIGLSPINEAYFGKTPEVLAIEKAVTNIRKNHEMKDMNRQACKKLTNSKEWKDLSKSIEKAFGFKRVVIGIDYDDRPNLSTYPLDAADWGNLTTQYITTSTGLKFKKELEAETMIFFTKGILFDDLFTDAELTATLLHEIGHNFEDAVMPIKQITKFIGQALSLYNNIGLSSIKDNISDLFKNGESNIKKFIDFVTGFFKAKPNLLFAIKNNKEKSNEYNYIKPGFLFDDAYLKEKFADHFATMYGYGVEISTALVKLERTDTVYKGIISSILSIILSTVLNIIFGSSDIHPKLSARIKNSINELNHELLNNKELSNADRKDIEKQISDIKKTAEEYYTNGEATGFITRQYFKFLYKHLNNGDWVGTVLSNLYDLNKIDQNIEQRKK